MQRSEIFKKLSDFIKIESVSTDKNRFSHLLKAAEFIRKELLALDFKVDIYQKKESSPLLIGKKTIASKAKTLCFYAHYDVQPEDPLKDWQSPPFELSEKNNRYFGRGIADDKGHLFQLLVSARELVKANSLKNNLIFIFEGEEEIGSPNFEELIQKDDDIKNVDAFYLVDMEVRDKETAKIFYGLRGIVGFELKLKTAENDLHSGVFGNLVDNPVQIVANLLSKIKSTRLKIKIPRFYDKVRKISKGEIQLLKKSGEVQAKIYPSFDVNGIVAGFTGEGIKTIIPSQATVKFSFRLVPDQDPREIQELVLDFIKKQIPKKIAYEIKIFHSSNPLYVNLDNEFIKKTAQVLRKYFKKGVLFDRSGGSIASAEILFRLYKKPVILIGFINPESNIHAPNENFDKELFFKGIEVLRSIFNLS
ncbi:MAG: M20/M25/M40 family metallo-hydrolase [Patescibacteria group bacterium]|nr:M20/M25/M40 family metallo-hydrolase [Patescibacteria group bacterium]